MKKVLITTGVIIALIIIWVISNGKSPQNDEFAMEPEASQVTWIETVPAASNDIETYITETGTTIPTQFAVVSSEVSGKIISLNKDVGDFLNKDDIIAQIDDELMKLSVDRANAQLINTAATLEKAEKDLERYKILLDKTEVSEGEFETVKLQYELARSANLNAEASLKTDERQLRNTKIKNSFRGQIAEKYVQEGDMVSIGTSIVKVVDINELKVKINISETDIVRVKINDEASVELDAYPGRVFTGKIHSLSPEGRIDTHTFPVEIIIRNTPDYIIKSGMVARVRIKSNTIENAVLIPNIAVIERYGRYFVYVAEGEKAVEKQVTLGVEHDTDIQILSGIAAGENIVIAGQHSLKDGDSIKIK
ncbi:efflux RND transporter periplasmic adaptor subunit [candidate division KSB1 bacterium]